MTGRKMFALLLAIAIAAPLLPIPSATADHADVGTGHDPIVVIAHIDGGINPYNPVFRDDGPLAYVHPCNYIAGYPCSVPELKLSLNESSFSAAFALDKPIWDNLLARWNNASDRANISGKPFWISGTKIVAAVRMGAGGTGGPDCQLTQMPTAIAIQKDPTGFNNTSQPLIINPGGNPTSVGPNGVVWSSIFPITVGGKSSCPDYPILDEHGHATMTATRMGGNDGSLCPECRIVSIEGLGGASTKWAADQGWIDVQTNSWLGLIPPPLDQQTGGTTTSAFIHAQDKMLVFAASGNGAAYLSGFAPTPTEVLSTAAPGVILVGAHDNGYVTQWSGAPAHVVADGYGGNRGENQGFGFGPHPVSCCTSAASPYAAGGGAAIVLEARQLLGDKGTGLRVVGAEKALAVNLSKANVYAGPLSDGILTLDEAKSLIEHTAEARPLEGANDGLLHWVATGDLSSESASYIPTFGPGANPFCNGCWTSPVKWADVPADVPAYVSIGYGAINERSVALAADVLAGTETEPTRADVDDFFAAEAIVRAPFFGPVSVPGVIPSGPVLGSGTIHLPAPQSRSGPGMTEGSWTTTGSFAAQGVDGLVVALPADAPGKTITAAGVSPFDETLGHDLDIYFYDAQRGFVGGASETPDESTVVPAGAAFAVVDLFLGAEVDVVTYIS